MYKFESIIDNTIITVPDWNIERINELENDIEYQRIYEAKEASHCDELGDEWLPF